MGCSVVNKDDVRMTASSTVFLEKGILKSFVIMFGHVTDSQPWSILNIIPLYSGEKNNE